MSQAPRLGDRYIARLIVPNGRDRIERGALDVCGDRVVAVHAERPAPDQGWREHDLGEVAIVPGCVNAHSHAFQRALRGRTEWLHRDRASEDFWSWREAMYELAQGYDLDGLYEVSRRAFEEMLRAGITCVGEFHYLHHRPGGASYDEINATSHRVIEAALDAGLRVTLLKVAYQRAGFERELEPAQRRFVFERIGEFLSSLEALAKTYANHPRVRLGVAPHSVRAVGVESLRRVAEWASARQLPLHVHACEQREELRQSVAEYGATPIHVLDNAGALSPRTTLVHATHVSDSELDLIASRGATVCACPTTERNLGDGFLPAKALLERGVPIHLGSDSHARIDLWEERRLIEYHERLLNERRNVLASPEIVARWPHAARGARLEVARVLWPMAHEHGARALGWEGLGELKAGALADFVALSLEHPSLWGWELEHLHAQLVFGAQPGAVRRVFVGGEERLS